jgi:sirohydrochlorin ferrochelatase
MKYFSMMQAVMRWKHEELDEAMEQLEDMERLREDKEAVDRELARLKDGGGGVGGGGAEVERVEELLQVERELEQATRQLQLQVQYSTLFLIHIVLCLE